VVKALVVRGGWEGHEPVKATAMFLPFLDSQGYDVRIEDSPGIYASSSDMSGFDVIVQCMTMSTIEKEEVAGLRAAVAAGTGFTGWHGGIADSYRASSDYLQLVGGQFATHPSKEPGLCAGEASDNFLPYAVELTDLGRSHPITAGLDDFELETEQYWVLTDDLNDVLVTTTFGVRDDTPWREAVTCPAVWTRQWGQGKVFVSTIGHKLDDLDHPDVRTLTERGLLWASR
jgi:type 1 glutamine amidotransferase